MGLSVFLSDPLPSLSLCSLFGKEGGGGGREGGEAGVRVGGT